MECFLKTTITRHDNTHQQAQIWLPLNAQILQPTFASKLCLTKRLLSFLGEAPCQDADCHIPINAP